MVAGEIGIAYVDCYSGSVVVAAAVVIVAAGCYCCLWRIRIEVTMRVSFGGTFETNPSVVVGVIGVDCLPDMYREQDCSCWWLTNLPMAWQHRGHLNWITVTLVQQRK